MAHSDESGCCSGCAELSLQCPACIEGTQAGIMPSMCIIASCATESITVHCDRQFASSR